MIDTLHIRNLRGIQKLDATNLGRVNLVIGKNESGKTTFLAAAGMQQAPESWEFLAPYLDDPRPTPLNFERHWLPLFRGGDPATPAQVWTTRSGVATGWRLEATSAKGRPALPLKFTADPGDGNVVEWRAPRKNQSGFTPLQRDPALWWSPAFVESEETTLGAFLELYKKGRSSEVLGPLREVNPSIESVEVAGEHVYIRLAGHPLPMRLGVLGDGARRLLEFALALTGDVELILIDELENGLHYSTLPVALKMLQGARPDKQLFATTHRDELIRTACELFIEKGDPGLRIIRLDKSPTEHRVVVYTAEEALAGMDAGLELRG